MNLSRSMYDALSVETVYAFDLETTGLDPVNDEILEIGIVRADYGIVEERYSQLVKPTVPIPPFVTQLTGIQPADCENQPSIEKVFPEVCRHFEIGWIVAHNASFDMGFLRNSWRKYNPEFSFPASHRVIDTLDLSRALLPWLPNHRLGTIAEYLKLDVEPDHRALNDADTALGVFQELLRLGIALDLQSLDAIQALLAGTGDGLEVLFEKIHDVVFQDHAKHKKLKKMGPPNIRGQAAEPSEVEPRHVEEDDVNRFFVSDGDLAAVFPRYEVRRPQLEMARKVALAFNRDEFLVAEAGTGVGKSLAYLIPAVLWSMREASRRVVIATHTKTLQTQLFDKELPLLHDLMQGPFMSVLLKGRSNYVCIHAWENLVRQHDLSLTPSERKKLLPLVLWIQETKTGDIEENGGFSREWNKGLWNLLSCDAVQCGGSHCDAENRCFFRKIRRASRQADIVVINHSLLFSDLAAGFSVLGEYDTLIIDESHQVEESSPVDGS